MGYDAYFFALAALQKAGSTEPAKVMDAVWSTTIDGVTGPIALEQTNGDAIRNTAFVKQADTASGTWIALDPVTIG
jgi:branched-chain amino acid transport system substrate-binding protein